MRPFKTKAPFGIQTQRFNTIGFHPNLDPHGFLNAHKNKLGPGQYNPSPIKCTQSVNKKSPWTITLLSEEFSSNLGFKNNATLKQRRYAQGQGGPGVYDIPDSVYQKKSCSVKEDGNFGMEKKFIGLKNDNPGPGTYGKDISRTTMEKRRFSTLPSFESDGFIDRFRGQEKPWWQTPNRYDPIDVGSVDQLLSRVVSKRGPYDMFTGPRDGSTIKNHFAPPLMCTPDKFYTWPSDLDFLLHHPQTRRTGQFGQAIRFLKKPTVRMMLCDISTCYRDPKSPGPASYAVNNYCIRASERSLHPFNDSKLDVRPGIQWKISPGAGRYKVNKVRCTQKPPANRRPTSTFISKTGRTEYKAVNYNSF